GVGDGDQPGGVVAARRRGARRAPQARPVRRLREHALQRHGRGGGGRGGGPRRPGRGGRGRDQTRAAAPAGKRRAGAARGGRRATGGSSPKSRAAWVTAPHSHIAPRPTCSASTRRSPVSRTRGGAISISAALRA